MIRRSDCYVDTSGFIAFLDQADQYHQVFRQLFSDPPSLVTSALVVVEGHGWFLRKYNSHRAAQFLDFVREFPRLAIESFDKAALSDASRMAAKFLDQKLTLVDAHGLAIMKRLGTKSCWSTDRHMSITGVPLAIRNLP